MALEIILKVILGLMLFVCGIQDTIKKRIWIWIIVIGGGLTTVTLLFQEPAVLWNNMGGIAVGICVILISMITKGKIGLGDGMILCVTGLGMGFWENLELFAIALLLAAVLSIVLLSLRLADRKKSIPFIPFLFTSYIFLTIVSVTG